jgi:hypothetical protein
MNALSPLSGIKKRSAGEVVSSLLNLSPGASTEAGLAMTADATKYGLNMKDYLTLSIKSEGDMNGFELALQALNLPVRNDFSQGVILQAASDTFQQFPGTRAMFPPVIDTLLQWAVRQDQYEKTENIVGGSRTIAGTELISTVVSDDSAQRDTFTIPELANIPVRAIRTSENSVKMFKHGSGIRTSYEFQRRASLDIITPYAARIARQLEISKVREVTGIIVNGDGIHAAAPVVAQSSFNAQTTVTATAGKISWPHLLAWLVARAQAMTPVDTIIGNWDSLFRWAMLWQIPTANASGTSDAVNLEKVAAAYGLINIPLPKFAISSSAPANKLIGISRADTAEELVEAGSQIAESERAIRNQSIVYIKTETTGYRLVYGDSRSIYNYGA